MTLVGHDHENSPGAHSSGATIELPWPPTLNTYWRRVGTKTVLSRKAREFRGQVAAACAMQQAPRLGSARVRLTITAHPPDRRARDLDNLNKGVLDALAHARVFNDDAQVDDLRIVRANPCPGGRLTVHIEEMTRDPS